MKIKTRIDDKARATAIDVEKRRVRFLAQSAALGSDKLVILPGAGKKRNREYMANPIVVPYHMRYDVNGEPIVVGSVVETEFKSDGMYQTVEFAKTERGEAYWLLYRDKHMRAVSIAWSRDDKVETNPKKMDKLLTKHNVGLKPKEREALIGVVTEYRQTDLSLVAIGADPRAMIRSEAGEVAAELLDAYEYDRERGLYLGDKPERGRVVIDLSDSSQTFDETGLAKAVVEEINKSAARNVDVNFISREDDPDPPEFTTTYTSDVLDDLDEDERELDWSEEELRTVFRDELARFFEDVGFTVDKLRGVIPYKKYPLAPEGEAWSGPAEIRAADTDDLKVICTWYDSDNPDVKASYKLPHHKADGYKTVWRGVAAAMAVVFGARGGLKGKAAQDRKGIYNHLAKHYKDFDKEPPEFREDYDEETLTRLLADTDDEALDLVTLDLSPAEPVEETEPTSVEPKGSGNRLYADLLAINDNQEPPPARGSGVSIPDDLLDLAGNKE